jgi:hypothetical protein
MFYTRARAGKNLSIAGVLDSRYFSVIASVVACPSLSLSTGLRVSSLLSTV